VKAYVGAEIVCWLLEMARHRLLPRMQDEIVSQQYRERLMLRLKLQRDLFWGRIQPEHRCQPIGRPSRTVIPSAAAFEAKG
jgi:hypothetical protein